MKLEENSNNTKVFALGGLGEIGKNMYCVMHNDELIIIDAGIMFPEDELLGIDYVIPDFSFLKENESKIKGLFITHGHEDHIGGIPFLLQQINIPTIFAPRMAIELIKKKIEEKKINYKKLITIDDNTKIKFKYFDIDFFATTHSIPDSYGIALKTPNGVIVETGDFKFDLTPIGPIADLHKMARIGEKGVKLLMSDSTNALICGMSPSESVVDEALKDIFQNENLNRIIIATFASNVYRLKHIIETCKKYNRKICLFGRSMENYVEIAIETGLVKESDIFVTPEVANTLKPYEVCLLCTGSQGEPLAALSRIANGTHKQIKLIPKDIVIFSSSPIPGNNQSISKTINQLYLKGVKVYTSSLDSDIHASGHGSSEELKLMIRLFNPEYFMPVHGEYRMLKAHGDLGIACGIPKENIFILQNGDVLEIGNKIKKTESIPVEDIYIDGKRVGDIGNVVIRDRKIMANEGILVVIYTVDYKNNNIVKTNIITRGFILVNENEELISSIEHLATSLLKNKLSKRNMNYNDLKSDIIAELSPFIYNKTGRKPIILPVIMNIKKEIE